MRYSTTAQRVLIVSASEQFRDYFIRLLPRSEYAPVLCFSSAVEAKRAMLPAPADVVIINTPLPDDFGTQLALDIAEQQTAGVLLFVHAELYEQTVSQTREAPVFVLARPTNRVLILQALNLLNAAGQRVKYYRQKASSLETRIEEIRLVNRAKLMLITRLNMSEPEAHRYIEKTAMDRSIRKREVAETILRTYDN